MKFLKKLFRKKNTKANTPLPMPPWDEIVKIMYDKQLTFGKELELIKVIYCCDKTKRFVVLKDDQGLFTYHFEEIWRFDEDEWQYIGVYDDALPAMWESFASCGASFFNNEQDLMRDLTATYEYKTYFK